MQILKENLRFFGLGVTLVILILTPGKVGEAVAAPGWWIFMIEPAHVDWTSIDTDSLGNVHISYGDEYEGVVKYATNASGSWQTFTIDGDASGHSCDIAVDSVGDVHICYDTYNGGLKYATNASGSWETFDIDGPGTNCSIDTDSKNNVYISSTDAWHALWYATNASGSWETFVIDSEGGDSSLAIDPSNDTVHISYHDYTSDDLKYATDASGSWQTFRVDREGYVGWHNSIAIDFNSNVHISYLTILGKDLKYATNASGSWQTSTIDPKLGMVYDDTSIAVDSNNKVHISYQDNLYPKPKVLKYATNASGSWQKLAIDTGGAASMSIAIDSNNNVHISYSGWDWVRDEPVLMYATYP